MKKIVLDDYAKQVLETMASVWTRKLLSPKHTLSGSLQPNELEETSLPRSDISFTTLIGQKINNNDGSNNRIILLLFNTILINNINN